MRSILVFTFLILFFIASIPLYLIAWLIGRGDSKKASRFTQKLVVWAFNVILFICGVRKNVIGVEQVPKDEAVLYICNHRSYFDILLGYTTVPTLTSFVSKKEMIKFPFVNVWMKFLKCLFLDRDNIKEGLKTILQGIEQIKDGYSIFIMPEGTRNHEKEMLPFHEGSFKFAQKSGCAIVPIAMTHTDDIFEKHLPWMRPAKVTVMYGTPFYMNDLDKEDKKFIGSYTQNIIKDMLHKIETEIEA